MVAGEGFEPPSTAWKAHCNFAVSAYMVRRVGIEPTTVFQVSF